ncbi:hypothetical protein BWQ96_07387 [Gracilariopsis chorda]|uniref:Uncharacterized protein n=1 Tax=Gracilariopsis chorda TaxID=448386 RepID=A0A2V3ILD8_9FLOR|nr:hypothetical protein BWQ96_07387 [Gracilariopsis chorda]|eukprot:PXF42879.1 hypothetical protein BWQ96_07387 [Gracilariopsis chorda]
MFRSLRNSAFHAVISALDGIAIAMKCTSLREAPDPIKYYNRKKLFALCVQATVQVDSVLPSFNHFISSYALPKSDPLPLLPEKLRSQREIPPRYDPHALEQVLYQWWESAGLENRDLFGIVSDIAVQALSDSREDFNFFDFKVIPFASGKLIREAYDTSDAFFGRKQTLAVS